VAYPDDLLSPDERVVLHKHPHWKMLFLPVLVALIAIGGGAFLAAIARDNSWNTVIWIALGVVVLVLVTWLTLVPFLRWKTTHFIVTTDRVMAREGVLKRTGMDIPLSRINSVRFEHSVWDRVLGCGTLIVESASDEPLEFDDIPKVESVHSLLYREVNDNPDDDFHAPSSGQQLPPTQQYTKQYPDQPRN
jgi:uncharacterized membrane protein YdbT with pleckstrin-like domain